MMPRLCQKRDRTLCARRQLAGRNRTAGAGRTPWLTPRFAAFSWLFVGIFVGCLATADGQESAQPAGTAESAASTTGESPPANPNAAAAFAAKLQEWKDVIKGLRDLRSKFENSESADEADGYRDQYEQLLEQGRSIIPQLRELGIQAYVAAPNVDFRLSLLLFRMIDDDIKHDRYESALELAEVMIEHDCPKKEIYCVAGVAAFCSNHFEKAKSYLTTADEAKLIVPVGEHKIPQVRAYLELADKYIEYWREEQRLREEQSGQLPVVKLTTTKGDIVVELFEKEAPETVANFIYLVEKKFYDGREFHRVLSGFMAQTGRDTTGEVGYNIYCECYKEGYRRHFRGSVSMALEVDPIRGATRRNSGSSQFFITFVPTPDLDGVHTVFGRVIDGMDVLSKIERSESDEKPPQIPDKIVHAELIHRTKEKYLPTKVKD